MTIIKTVPIDNINKLAPTGIMFDNSIIMIAENTSTATRIKVADIAISDDTLGINSLSLSGRDASSFEIDRTALYLKAGTSLNFEAKSNYAVTVNVKDSMSLSSKPDATADFTLVLTDVNEAPNAVALTVISINEYVPANRLVGSFSTSAPDVGDASNYTLVTGAVSTRSSQMTTITIETVPVGDVNNPGSWPNRYTTTRTEDIFPVNQTGLSWGSVSYYYSIGKYEVTLTQYAEFLNAVAKSDPYKLYNPFMETRLSYEDVYGNPVTAGISRSGVSGSYTYSVIGNGNYPVGWVNWFDAARFTNWLHNGAGTAYTPEAAYELTETGAYTLNGMGALLPESSVPKNTSATWWIPSEHEWIKAGHYDLNGAEILPAGPTYYWSYPTESIYVPGNTVGGEENQAQYSNASDPVKKIGALPVGSFTGSESPYGTYDQGGNVAEWTDGLTGLIEFGLTNGMSVHGGFYDQNQVFLEYDFRYSLTPVYEGGHLGFRVATTAINAAPTALTLNNLFTSAISENTTISNRIKVADIAITDDFLGANVLSLSGADSSDFELDGAALYFKAGTSLNFEAKSSYGVTVNVKDVTVNNAPVGPNPDATANFTLNVVDVNEAPTALNFNNSVTAIAENTTTTNRIKVADIAIIDDALGTNLLSLSGDDASSFELDGTALYLKAGTSLNFEAKSSYAVTVNVTDLIYGYFPVAAADFTLPVTDINEAPTVINLSATSINENVPENSVVGTVSTEDPDVGDAFIYALVGGAGSTDNNRFILVNGELRIKSSPDFEVKSSYTIRVRSTDIGGRYIETPFNITINDLDNIVTGTNANETFLATRERDIIDGGGGNDTFTVAVANLVAGDNFNGNTGIDTFTLSQGTFGSSVEIDLIQANQLISLTGVTGVEVAGFENIRISSFFGSGLLTGDGNANTFIGGLGNDTLNGEQGDDRFSGGAGNDVINGGDGRDTLTETADVNFTAIEGTLTGLGTDTFSNIEILSLYGGGSNNTIDVSQLVTTRVFLYGRDGNDNLLGGAGGNYLYGENGNDTLVGGLVNDNLDGGAGNDTLNGEQGDDRFSGGAGNDVINGGDGRDTLTETADVNFTAIEGTLTGLGTDTFSNIEILSLYGGGSNNTIDVSQLVTTRVFLYGRDGNDNLLGGAGGNYLYGENGNDTLVGGLVNDNLDGGVGNDLLNGGIGRDTLTGGADSDFFDYRNLGDSRLNNSIYDLITDFDANTDKFLVSNLPTRLINTGLIVSRFAEAQIQTQLNSSIFANTGDAALFTVGSRTFIALNDSNAGFQGTTDILIELRTIGLVGTISLSNFTTMP